MALEQTLRHYRKELGLSQEKLAENLNVSRQAITKWETGGGLPDIGNLQALANLFEISLDQLLQENIAQPTKDFLYQSYTSYDIDRPKRFDLKLGVAHEIRLQIAENEKIEVYLKSNTIEKLEQICKLKLDDQKKALDVNLKQSQDLSQNQAKEDLTILVKLPEKYLENCEIAANCQKIDLLGIKTVNIEFDGRASEFTIKDCQGHIELNNNLDSRIFLSHFKGKLDLNQVSCSSKLYVPKDFQFASKKRCLTTKMTFEKNGQPTSDFSNPEADNTIELNGIKSELTIIQD
ncbi:helix-turn-helix domain-containing protein [Streptococcus sobrinus]|uniref:XRE family transcriptional regulator n=1 Tax=Streptococcus sobrinus TaxID=1310 RepID=A0ABM6W3A4_9STRE|nr:helix-turn-helix transcriptional regulator [Streptococcus sobrinus]AWN17995.1 XRE family transcriptional regulator [Streptococcus sobrinus]AWN19901.1 XRE family transcriptional regulator [Streptococcus sobrinus]EMP72777.1 XRE family transcriptional regulator [Streptococcus sobrinus DSM 20742 = ATCC 33478]SQG12600.1 transcriptional regulator [Streptococcus sobrinus]